MAKNLGVGEYEGQRTEMEKDIEVVEGLHLRGMVALDEGELRPVDTVDRKAEYLNQNRLLLTHLQVALESNTKMQHNKHTTATQI